MSLWGFYNKGFDDRQKINSKRTSRRQLARCFSYGLYSGLIREGAVVFDLGCGHANQLNKDLVINNNAKYYCCDLYNLSIQENLTNISQAKKDKVDLVIISNVLNVIKEREVRLTLLTQAKSLLSVNGRVLISIYEGRALSSELSAAQKTINLKPTLTKDGWQNRWKTQKYLSEVKEIFPDAKIISGRNSSDKFILC